MQKNKWFIGKKIYGPYPVEAAVWAGQNNASIDGTHFKEEGYFEIVKNAPIDYTALKIDELQKYLNSTDWYVTRFAETGVEIPEDVKEKRAEARKEIDRLRELKDEEL